MKKTKSLLSLLLFSFLFSMFLVGCSSGEPPSGLPDIYAVAQDAVKKQLLSPATAVFPDFDKSFVHYDRSVLEDCGEGIPLEYRVYRVDAYVDSSNAFGTPVRTNFIAEVYCYVDDYVSAQFGEQGIHKNIEDHYYTSILELE